MNMNHCHFCGNNIPDNVDTCTQAGYACDGNKPFTPRTMNQIPNIEEVVEQFMMTWFRPAYFEALTPTNRQEQVIYDEAKLKWETCKQQLTETLHHQLQKAREEEREKIAEMLSKAGDNKISMLDDDNFTGTYWISLNDAYRLLTGRQVNHDWEQGKIEKNATVEMVIRKSINPDHSELDQDKTNGL